MKMAVCTSATPMLTPTRAETMAGVRTGESRSRRRIFFCRQVTRVSAAPNVAPVAIAQPSRPGVMYWIVFSDWSSTWATSTENLVNGHDAALDGDAGRRVEPAYQRRGWIKLQDLAVVHDGHPVAECLGLVQVVDGQHHGAALVVDVAQQIPQVAPRLRVQARGRLVEEDQLRTVHQGTGDGQPLHLAAGQLFAAHVRLFRQPHDIEHLIGLFGRYAIERGERADLFARGEPLEKRRGLQLYADARQQCRVTGPG